MCPLESWEVFDVPQIIIVTAAFLDSDAGVVEGKCHPFGNLFLLKFYPAFCVSSSSVSTSLLPLFPEVFICTREKES